MEGGRVEDEKWGSICGGGEGEMGRGTGNYGSGRERNILKEGGRKVT